MNAQQKQDRKQKQQEKQAQKQAAAQTKNVKLTRKEIIKKMGKLGVNSQYWKQVLGRLEGFCGTQSDITWLKDDLNKNVSSLFEFAMSREWKDSSSFVEAASHKFGFENGVKAEFHAVFDFSKKKRSQKPVDVAKSQEQKPAEKSAPKTEDSPMSRNQNPEQLSLAEQIKRQKAEVDKMLENAEQARKNGAASAKKGNNGKTIDILLKGSKKAVMPRVITFDQLHMDSKKQVLKPCSKFEIQHKGKTVKVTAILNSLLLEHFVHKGYKVLRVLNTSVHGILNTNGSSMLVFIEKATDIHGQSPEKILRVKAKDIKSEPVFKSNDITDVVDDKEVQRLVDQANQFAGRIKTYEATVAAVAKYGDAGNAYVQQRLDKLMGSTTKSIAHLIKLEKAASGFLSKLDLQQEALAKAKTTLADKQAEYDLAKADFEGFAGELATDRQLVQDAHNAAVKQYQPKIDELTTRVALITDLIEAIDGTDVEGCVVDFDEMNADKQSAQDELNNMKKAFDEAKGNIAHEITSKNAEIEKQESAAKAKMDAAEKAVNDAQKRIAKLEKALGRHAEVKDVLEQALKVFKEAQLPYVMNGLFNLPPAKAKDVVANMMSAGITSVSELVQYSAESLLKIKGFGKASLEHLQTVLSESRMTFGTKELEV